MKEWIVETLLRLYPAAWRREYGPELKDMLLARQLTAGIVGDVFQNGLRQRVRGADHSTLVGLAMLLVILNGFVWNIVVPAPSSNESIVLLQHPLGSNLYILALLGCGCWTYLRHSGELSKSGRAAMKISFIAGIPVMLAGILMLLGILGVSVLEPGETPTTFHEHGFAFTYYSAQNFCWLRVSEPASRPFAHAIQSATCPPAPLGMMISPLFILPASWLWGVLGGLLGRWIAGGQGRGRLRNFVPY